jgi:hypothetical protein
MPREYEVVHLVDGHFFDAESYELTSVGLALSQYGTGYYVVPRTPGQDWTDEAAAGLVGPFANARQATLALRALELPGGASTHADGSLAAATARRDEEQHNEAIG